MWLSDAAFGQHVNLFWYNLKSVQPLTQEQGKNAVSLISELTSDSLLSFNQKSSMFLLAAHTPVDFDVLIPGLNQLGYYIADVTGGLTHQAGYVKSGYNYQAAVLLLNNEEQFLHSDIDSIILNQAEAALLEEIYHIDPNDYSVFILSAE